MPNPKNVYRCNKCQSVAIGPRKHCDAPGCPWWRCTTLCKAVNETGTKRFFVDDRRRGV